MGEAQITYLLLSLILFENYFVLKKYKSIFLNIITVLYVVSVPFYCFMPKPQDRFWVNFLTLVFAIMFILIVSSSLFYIIKLSKKESKKYPFFGLGLGLFFLSNVIVDLLMK